jgi:tRNA (guanine-N7-)-methyltransferase
VSITTQSEADSALIAPGSWTQLLSIEELYPHPERPLEIDIGCGKGRFLTARAISHPETNFLGIDRLLSRLMKIDKKIKRNGIENTRVIRIENSYAVEHLLPASSVSAFYIFFPDPWPKNRHRSRRLFNEAFLTSLHSRMAPDGCIHVATDHLDYFKEIYSLFTNDERFAQIDSFIPTEEEQTDFERIFLSQGKEIGRCSYRSRESGTK